MDSLPHLRHLFAFETWAQEEVLATLLALDPPPERAASLFDHLLGAGFLWHARLCGEAGPLAVWPAIPTADRRARAAELSRAWGTYLAGLAPADLSRAVDYRNTKGEAWTNTVEAILTHVILHAAYHRGQIATALREAGHAPPYVDYIQAVRSGALAP